MVDAPALAPEGDAAPPPRPERWVLAGLLLLVAALTGVAVLATWRQQVQAEGARLEAVSDLRARQVAQWLQERRRHAEFVADSPYYARLVQQSRSAKPGDAQAVLQQRIQAFAQSAGVEQALLLDEQGRPVGTPGPLPADLGMVARQSLADGQVRSTALAHDPAPGASGAASLRMYLVAPLRGTGRPAQAALALALVPEAWLLPMVQAWPVPSHSATVGLVARVGDTLVGVNGRNPRPLDSPKLLAAQVLRGEQPFGQAAQAEDFRGIPVLGVVRPLPELNWYLTARIDMAEVRRNALADATPVVASGATALLAVLVGAHALRERRRRHEAVARQQAQAHELKALADLQDSRGRLGQALMLAGMGTWEWEIPSDRMRWSPECLALLGPVLPATAEEAFARHVHPQDLPALRQALDDTLHRRQPFQHDLRWRTSDARELWLANVAQLQCDAQGQPLRLLGTMQDVTTWRRTHSALRERDALFREMGELAHIGGWAWDVRTRTGEWTDEVARIHGYGPDTEPSPDAARRCFRGEHLQRLDDAVRAALRHGTPYDLELEMTSLQGQRKWVRTMGLPTLEGARVVHLHGYTQDITSRKLAELALQHHREHLQELVHERTAQIEHAHAELQAQAHEIEDLYNRAPVGYHSLDAQGRIVAVNDTELQMLGWHREQLLGQSLKAMLLPPEHWAMFDRAFANLHAGGQLLGQRIALKRADGTLLPVMVNAASVLDEHGRLLRTRTVVMDDSERRAAEQRIAVLNTELERRAIDAEAASRAKSAFLANMSHEIRTPMNAIIGLTQLLRQDATDPQVAQRLDTVGDAAHHLLEVINDVLDLSKIEAGKMTLEAARFSLQAVLARLDGMLGERARAKGLALTLAAPGVPAWLHGDATRLTQALLNLLGNALKFTEHGGVALQAELLAREGERLHLKFSVRDTGPGIPTDQQARLFSAFEQADASTTRRYGGTGLGLAITRHLARLMGGRVGMSSAPGQGSVFWFTAWLQQAQADEAGAAGDGPAAGTPAPARPGSARVLLAEDNAVNREVATQMLAACGVAADVAEDGQAALARASAQGYELILMDMQMPGMDGLQATRAIRRLPQHAATPIVAMTANAFNEDRQACLDAGMNDHLAKPVDMAELRRVLARWLAQPRSSSG